MRRLTNTLLSVSETPRTFGHWKPFPFLFLSQCSRSFRVVKEIRFHSGLPPALLERNDVAILHLVRDPRAVVKSRLKIPAFCGTRGAPGESTPAHHLTI